MSCIKKNVYSDSHYFIRIDIYGGLSSMMDKMFQMFDEYDLKQGS